MHVQQYLKTKTLKDLNDEFGIISKLYPEHGLIVLNYDQIESSKTSPIVLECRGLILDNEYNVVSRAFDRFFNMFEQGNTEEIINIADCVAFDKIDGSLIRIYHHRNEWHIATRGTAFAESTVNGFPITFRDLVLKALNLTSDAFQERCNWMLDEGVTYIFEVTSIENQVVRRYEGYTLHYLASRHRKTFEYLDSTGVAFVFGAVMPRKYLFNTVAGCVESAKNLKNLDEGYVLYKDGVPVCKIKSPQYCAVHLIKGEGLNPKRIMQLVLTGETSEYLTYFPDDLVFLQPYIDAFVKLQLEMVETYDKFKDITEQKEFALAVKDYPYSGTLFLCRRHGTTPVHEFNEGRESSRMDVLSKCMVSGEPK